MGASRTTGTVDWNELPQVCQVPGTRLLSLEAVVFVVAVSALKKLPC